MQKNENIKEIQDFLTIKELQGLLRVSKNTAYNLVRSGEIKAKTVGRQWRVPRSEYERYTRT